MLKNYQQISPYRYETTDTDVPIIFHLQSSLFPNDEALEQLKDVANTAGVYHHVAVLSDVHPKKGRKCPTGVAIAADRFLPQTMDSAPNCGMRMFTFSKKYSEVGKEKIDSIFQKLIKEIPTQTTVGTPISYRTVLDTCRYGTKGLIENLKNKWKFIDGEVENTFQNGNEFFGDKIPDKAYIEAVVPKVFLKMAQLRMGILGMAGNHFLDLMRVEKIEDKEKAKILGIEEDQLIFFMHTGSGILGQYASYFYTPKEEEHFITKVLVNLGRMTMSKKYLTAAEIKQLRKDSVSYRRKKEFFSIDPESRIGNAYHAAHQASGNFGYANRAILSAKIRRVVEAELGKQQDWNLIYDMPHIGVRKEKHFGKDIWVHRNGVSRAFGPKRMKDHPVYSKTGEICYFAGSMTTPSYLAAATDENESTFYSASHGAGKRKNEPKKFGKNELFTKVEKDGVKLYNARSRGIVKQYSAYYKNITEVMQGIAKNNIAQPVAKLAPIAVLMA